MSLKIKLPVVRLNANKDDVLREMIFEVSDIAIEDWFGADRTTPIPNTCKIFCNGDCYRVKISRLDLENFLKESGINILQPINK